MKEVRIQAVVDPEKCTGCDTCIHVCPTTAFTRPEERPIERRMLPPCNAACPAGNDVEGFVTLIQQGKWNEASKLLRDTNPLPGVTGRVCAGYCRKACNRGRYDEPVSIKELERAIADYRAASSSKIYDVKTRHKEKVAIIGSGPAGLSCAYHLIRQGFGTTVFEERPQLGGILRYGIPTNRPPQNILDAEIEALRELGIDFKPDRKYGDNFQAAVLEDYQAVYLASEALLDRKATYDNILADIGGPGSLLKIFEDKREAADGISIAHAIGRGRRDAKDIADYLLGKSSGLKTQKKPVVSAAQMNFDYYDPAPSLNLEQLSSEAATKEADRCMHCGVMPEFNSEYCRGCSNCSSRCPAYAISIKGLEQSYVVKVDLEESLMEEAERISLRAGFNPKLRICACTGTKAVEVATAILKGAKTPEGISRATGVRTGCTSCIEPILCLLEAAGIELKESQQPHVWYPTVVTIWDVPKNVIDEYQDRGFRFEGDKLFYEKIGRRRMR